MVFSHHAEQDNDKSNVEPVHSYDAFHTRLYVGRGVKGIIGMHRFNICLVVVLLRCENTIMVIGPVNNMAYRPTAIGLGPTLNSQEHANLRHGGSRKDGLMDSVSLVETPRVGHYQGPCMALTRRCLCMRHNGFLCLICM